MNASRTFRIAPAALAVAIAALVAVGCKKKEEPAPAPPAATEPAPAPAPVEAPPAPAPTAAVTAVDFGSETGADLKLTAAKTTFGPKDRIIASVSTATSDPAATISGALKVRFTFQDGQLVHEDTQVFNFAGTGTNNFEIKNPAGWPVGTYTVEVSLNDQVVQSKTFTVQ